MKLAVKIAAILALTVGLVAVWLHGLDLDRTFEALASVPAGAVLAAAALGLLHVPARALRWRALLDVGGPPTPFRELVAATAIGYAVTFAVPGRLGEVVRPGILSRRTGVPFGATLASVVFERLLDLATLLALLAVHVTLSPTHATPGLRKATWTAAAGVGLATAVAIALHRTQRSRLDRLVHALARRLPGRLGRGFERLGLTGLRGFDSLLRPGAWWRLPVLSLVTWAGPAAVYTACLGGLGASLPWTSPAVLLGFGAVGIALPTPAGIGGFHELATHAGSVHLGLSPETAAAVAVLAHATSVVPVLALGLYFCWRDGMSWSGLRRVAAAADERAEEQDA